MDKKHSFGCAAPIGVSSHNFHSTAIFFTTGKSHHMPIYLFNYSWIFTFIFSSTKLEKPKCSPVCLSISVYLQSFNPHERCTCIPRILLLQVETNNTSSIWGLWRLCWTMDWSERTFRPLGMQVEVFNLLLIHVAASLAREQADCSN